VRTFGVEHREASMDDLVSGLTEVAREICMGKSKR
jgi:hypothetical protein